jgi:hypothetical protein
MANKSSENAKPQPEGGDDGTRLTPEEIAQLYELEPTLREVITEGVCDAGVVRWFLRLIGSDVNVYTVDDRLVVDPEAIKVAGEIPGNRGAVVTAAMVFARASLLYAVPQPDVQRRVSFIYDRDDDALTGKVSQSAECLLPSDYSSIEMYCFATGPVDKLLKVTLRASDDIEASDVLESITSALVDIAVLRHILRTLGRPTALILDTTSRCKIINGTLVVDISSLAEASINKKGGPEAFGATYSEVVEKVGQIVAELRADPRLIIRGHDYTEIICYYLRTKYKQIFNGPHRSPLKVHALFENVLVTCLELQDLSAEPLFVELAKRYGNASAESAA